MEALVHESLAGLVAFVPSLVAASLVVVLLFGLGRIAARAVDRLTDARGRDRRAARLTRSMVRWAFSLVGLVLALHILGLTAMATSLLATGGLVAVVLGFAFREIGENLLAGIFLGLSRSFEVGDLIESSGHEGTVRSIELRHVHVRTADGRDVFIPSGAILRNVLVNFTRDDLRRGNFTLGIDYGDSLERALSLALDAIRGIDGVLDEPAISARISSFEPQYVELKMFFWVNTETGPGLAVVRSNAMAACLGALRGAGMTVSSDVSSAVTLSSVDVRVEQGDGARSGAHDGPREDDEPTGNG